jgi:hypothetical protein
MVSRCAVLCVLVVAIFAPRNAAAEEVRVRLHYERSASAVRCADEQHMRDAVAARLGYDPFAANSEDLVAIALDRRGTEWTARIDLQDRRGAPKGTRSLRSSEATCDELISAVSLAIALAIDPMRLQTPPPPVEVPVATPPVPAAVAAPAARTEETAPVPPSPPAVLFASAGAFVVAGVVPSVSFGPRLRFGARWPRVSVAIEGIFVAPASQDSPSGRVEALVVAGGLTPCFIVHPSDSSPRMLVEACARGVVGGLFGEASGVGKSTPSTSPYAGLGAEVAFELPLSSTLAVRPHGGALVTVTRTFLRIRNGQSDVDIWRSPLISGGGGVDAVLHFP